MVGTVGDLRVVQRANQKAEFAELRYLVEFCMCYCYDERNYKNSNQFLSSFCMSALYVLLQKSSRV